LFTRCDEEADKDYKHWLNTEGCRQAKELVTQVTPGLTQFALRQCRRDLRTLVYLLTGHITPSTGRLNFGVPFLEPSDLKQAHCITLLRFAKTTNRFQ